MFPLAETFTAETGVSLGFLLAVIAPVGTAIVSAMVVRALQGKSIADMEINQKAFNACVQKLETRVLELETDKKIRDALAEDRASEVTPRPVDVSRSGVRPRGRS
jgi:hypothetical protein